MAWNRTEEQEKNQMAVYKEFEALRINMSYVQWLVDRLVEARSKNKKED